MISKIIEKFSQKSPNIVYLHEFETCIGKVLGAADENFLYVVTFEDSKNCEKPFQILTKELNCSYEKYKNKILEQFESELIQYLHGRIKKFTVPIKTVGSEFQKDVWNKLMELPYASTQTYGDMAKALGRPASHARAVGAACGANAHLLVIPCHRLVASGSKGGFSSGVDRKEWLIRHEQQYA